MAMKIGRNSFSLQREKNSLPTLYTPYSYTASHSKKFVRHAFKILSVILPVIR